MTKKLSLLGFVSITIAMVMDIYEYPVFATSGFQLLFFLLMGGLLWFLPVSLCAAEMATVKGWEAGGLYSWVKNTLGERLGFVAIFFQWLQVTVGFITMLYFILSAFAYAFDLPEFNTNPVLKFIGIMVIFWGLTATQLFGTKYTEWFGKIGTVVGIIIPAIVLFTLSLVYLVNGGTFLLSLNAAAFIPDFSKPATLVVFISFLLSYMGIEASASYVNELDNPKRNYPLAMMIVVVAAIVLNAIGGLSIAMVIPQAELSLSGGILQAFEVLFGHIHPGLTGLAKVLGFMISIGVIAEITGWIVGPMRGLYVAAQQGLLPVKLRKVNKHNIPTRMIFMQSILVSFWAALLTFAGGGNNFSFLIAIALTVIIYLIAYVLFFIGYLVLVYKKQDLERGFHVPGGIFGKTSIALVGLLTSILAFGISFVPPNTIAPNMTMTYEILLACSFLLVFFIPFLLYAVHDKQKHKTIGLPKRIVVDEINRFRNPRARGIHQILPDKEQTDKQ